MKGGLGLRRKISAFDRYSFTSICCVYKEKIVKKYSYRRTQRPYKFGKLQHLTRIVKKNQFNSEQII